LWLYDYDYIIVIVSTCKHVTQWYKNEYFFINIYCCLIKLPVVRKCIENESIFYKIYIYFISNDHFNSSKGILTLYFKRLCYPFIKDLLTFNYVNVVMDFRNCLILRRQQSNMHISLDNSISFLHLAFTITNYIKHLFLEFLHYLQKEKETKCHQ
jgi:uncharacterized protein YerC